MVGGERTRVIIQSVRPGMKISSQLPLLLYGSAGFFYQKNQLLNWRRGRGQKSLSLCVFFFFANTSIQLMSTYFPLLPYKVP